MFKKLILTFLIIAFAGVAVCVGINWYMDSYFYFRVNSGYIDRYDSILGTRNERMLASYLLKNKPKGTYDGIIVGGSKSRPFTPTIFNNMSGSNYLSCSGGNGEFGYYEKIIDYAIENQGIKNVVLHLGGREVSMKPIDDIKFRMPAALENKPQLLDTVFYAFTDFTDIIKSIKKDPVPSIGERFSKLKIASRDPLAKENKKIAHYLNLEEENAQTDSWIGSARIDSSKTMGIVFYYDEALKGDPSFKEEWKNKNVLNDKEILSDDDNTYSVILKRVFEEKPHLPYVSENIQSLKRIKQKCDENKVKLTVVMGSMSIVERARYEGNEYWNYLREIADITDYYDFSYFCDINNNPFNFLDGRHNLDTVAWVMISKLYGYDPYGFGKYVTKDNVDEHLIERKKAYNALKEEYERTGALELPGQNDASDLSDLPAEFFEGIKTVR